MPNDIIESKIAVLIDGENISTKYLKGIFEEIAKEGIVTYKRVYANWTAPTFSNWQEILFEYAITPMQQFNVTNGKSSSDGALIIDAMDILYSNTVDKFCLISSDSDFTKLATRLREAGMKVIGLGEEKSSKNYVKAFDRFIYLESLIKNEAKISSEYKKFVKKPLSNKKLAKHEVLDSLHASIIGDIYRTITEDEEGHVDLALMTQIIKRLHPDFDSKNYNFNKMSDYILSLGPFAIKKEGLVAYVVIKEE